MDLTPMDDLLVMISWIGMELVKDDMDRYGAKGMIWIDMELRV